MDYAIEVYWKGMTDVPEDAIAVYLAATLDSSVIISDDSVNPYSWLLVSPSGQVEIIDLDIVQLDESSTVSFRVNS